MNLFKKLDIFLLEKFPLLWHTKLLYAAFFSLIISALFYLWGYAFTNEFYINRFSENSYFERSNALLCFLIVNAIFMIVWALAFYRKSAVKNLYPLQRFYFTRLFCSFLFIFWSLSWSFTTFNWGVDAKIRKLAPLTELKEHIETINFADAFLFSNSFNYDTYINTYYPDVVKTTFDFNDSTWQNVPTIFYRDTLRLKSTENNYRSEYAKKIPETEIQTVGYDPSKYPMNNDTVERQIVQYLLTKSVVTETKCSGTNETLYLIGAKKREQLCPNELYDLRNFCKEEIDPNYFEYDKFENLFQEYAARRYTSGNSYIDYIDYIDPNNGNHSVEANKSFNTFLASSKKEGIVKLLEKYEQLLVRHQVAYSIDIPEIVNYVWKRQRNMNFPDFMGETANNSRQAEIDLARFGNLENYEAFRAGTKEYEQPLYFVETSHLDHLYSNSLSAHDPVIKWTPFMSSIYFALGFAFLFFLFAIGNPINIIIAASVGGVLLILNVLFFLVFMESMNGFYEDQYDPAFRVFSQALIFSGILYSLLYIFYAKKHVSKRLLLITFNLCFAVTILLPAFTFQFLECVLKRKYMDSCFNQHTEHSIFYYWGQDPIVIWLSVFGAILVFTHFIKPVLAKPE
jgi:hypothetical protein